MQHNRVRISLLRLRCMIFINCNHGGCVDILILKSVILSHNTGKYI